MVKCLHLTMLNCKRPRLLCAYGMSRKRVRSQFFYLSVDTWMGASTKQKRPPRLAMASEYMIDFCKSNAYRTANSDWLTFVTLVMFFEVVAATMFVWFTVADWSCVILKSVTLPLRSALARSFTVMFAL